MKDMGKEIVSGLVIIAGASAIVVAGETSLPFLATIGALSALGAGVYSAVSAPRRNKETRRTPDDEHREDEHNARTLVHF